MRRHWTLPLLSGLWQLLVNVPAGGGGGMQGCVQEWAREVLVVWSWAERDRGWWGRVAARCDYNVHAQSQLGIDKSRDRLRNSG